MQRAPAGANLAGDLPDMISLTGHIVAEAFIVDAVRTPVGRRGGGLSQVHPADLGAHSIGALMDRTGIDPAAVEDVMFGCVDTVGGQAGDIARRSEEHTLNSSH